MAKKEKSIYEIPRSKIIGEIRRQWFRSKHYVACTERAISSVKGSRGGKRYTCQECGAVLALKDVSVDHLIPVIPLDSENKLENMEDIINRMWAPIEDTKILCKQCHSVHTKADGKIRTANKRKRKLEQ